MLEIHSRRLPDREVHFTIITTDRSGFRFPSWPLIQDTIYNALHSQWSPDRDNFEQEVKRLIARFRKEILSASSINCRLMQYLQNSINACQLEDANAQAVHASDIFPGTLHCEAVLAAIGEYPDHAILDKNQTLINIAQVTLASPSHIISLTDFHIWQVMRQSPGIMVSKLCCPACWRLFRILSESDTPSTLFTVRGYHSVPYPVEVPAWLPEEVINKLIKFFQPILVDLLNSMDVGDFHAYEKFKKVHRSQESESNISETSAASSNILDNKRLGARLDEFVHNEPNMHGWPT